MTRHERIAWIVVAAALAAILLAFLLVPARLPHAWLAAFVALGLWPLGSMALLFIHALTGGRWGDALRPGLLAGAASTPLLVPLVVPILIALPALYPWARPEGAALPNRFWLNLPFFAVRGVIELLVWIGLALLAARGHGLARLAPFALLALAVTTTFAAIDFTMSLDPAFTSSAYGMIAGASAVLLALSCAILASPDAPPAVNDDIGRLLLALVALWTYLDFMQVLIVWQNDLAAQTPWYQARARGFWGWIMVLIALAHGVLPILALLAPRVRRSRAGLGAVAILLIVAELMRSWWTVLPAAPRLPALVDLACLLFMAALATGWTLRRSRHE